MLTAALLTAPATHAAEDCEDPESNRERFARHPWPTVDFGDGASLLNLPNDGVREPSLLEYFVSSTERVPKVESRVEYNPGGRDPSSRARLTRVWKFPGLEIEAVVAFDGYLFLRRIVLESADYPLICGLGVGKPLARFIEVLGSVSQSRDQPPSRNWYVWKTEFVERRVEFSLDPAGAVSRVVWAVESIH
jgi:hypothetical protein